MQAKKVDSCFRLVRAKLCRWRLVDTASDWFAVVGLAGITATVTGALINWLLQGRSFKQQQRIDHIKERIDKFYSPMIFHFENMKSWGAAWGKDTYVFAGETLGSKISDMNELMRSGLRFVVTAFIGFIRA